MKKIVSISERNGKGQKTGIKIYNYNLGRNYKLEETAEEQTSLEIKITFVML